MHPLLIQIGPVKIYSYGFFIAAAFLLGMGLCAHEAKDRGLDHQLVSDLGFYLLLSGIIGARLLYVLINPRYFLAHPLDIFAFWKGGLVFLGGALAAAITTWSYLKIKNQPFWSWTDIMAPGIAAGQAIGRIGCLMAGCCYGRACALPWAITFTNPDSLAPLNIPLHPTEIYHSLAGLLTLVILLATKKRLSGSGQLFGLFLILYSVLRFIIEEFRGDYRGVLGPLSVTQWISIGVCILGMIILIKRHPQQAKQ